MIQVTVRIVQRSTRNSNSQMLVNEKNSMLSNARLWTKTLAVVYFRKGVMPMLLKDTTFFRRKLRHKQLVGIAGIARIARCV